MIDFLSYAAGHLALVDVQPAQAHLIARYARAGYAESLVGPYAWTGLHDGLVVGCAGVQVQWEGRAITWAVLGRDMPRRCWPAVARKMGAVLAQAQADGVTRIEADVSVGFGAGCRLAALLGFTVEGLRKKYGPDGNDYFLYAKVA